MNRIISAVLTASALIFGVCLPGEESVAQTTAKDLVGTWTLVSITIEQDSNMITSDSQVACWCCKYKYNFLRPITAIHNADRLGNSAIKSDSNWVSLLCTPVCLVFLKLFERVYSPLTAGLRSLTGLTPSSRITNELSWIASSKNRRRSQ